MKKAKCLLFAVVLGGGFPGFSQTQVNLQEGSFHWTTQDVFRFGRKTTLQLERNYSSRSDFRGLLGRGWCSELEWTLVAQGKFALLMKCDQPEMLTADRFVVLPGTVRVKNGTQALFFHPNGKLESIEENGKRWFIQRDLKGRPLLAQSGSSILQMIFSARDELTKIQTASETLGFEYADRLLRSATGAKAQTYAYDEFENLTTLVVAGEKIEVRYDGLRDLALSIRAGGCEEAFEYGTTVQKNKVLDEVVHRFQCDKRAARVTRHRYEYQKTDDHQVRLERVSSIEEGGRP
jgi:hypothetical protein